MFNAQLRRSLETTVKDVWTWPEFQAFAKRLGIPVQLSCQYMSIVFDKPDSPVVISQTYQAEDANGMPGPDSRYNTETLSNVLTKGP